VILPLILAGVKKFMGGKNMDVNGLADMLGDTEGGGFMSKLKGLFGG
jgi:hypothetical protein